ncbi:MAG: hypothetical protein RL662_1263 [Bacteroidota bacterium]|jgi:tryptophan-rich sensory protein
MKQILVILLAIALCFLVGFVGSRFQLASLLEWYPTLNKPELLPPNYAFPIAWSILYACMGLSIGLIVGGNYVEKSSLLTVFSLQMLFNFTWSISFFYLRNPLLGLINIILLLLLIIMYAVKAYPVLKTSSILFIPYILWVSFATYLNWYIYLNN